MIGTLNFLLMKESLNCFAAFQRRARQHYRAGPVPRASRGRSCARLGVASPKLAARSCRQAKAGNPQPPTPKASGCVRLLWGLSPPTTRADGKGTKNTKNRRTRRRESRDAAFGGPPFESVKSESQKSRADRTALCAVERDGDP